jgi:release factor glutamine methyltransferase
VSLLAQRDSTLASIRRAAAAVLQQAGVETSDLDARSLVGHALGLDLTGLAQDPERVLSREELDHIDGFVARRIDGEPVARIVGVKEFWGLRLQLTADTLVPRPETETVVEAALAWLDARGLRQRPVRIADLGTGSGALLLALLWECPRASAVATDVSISVLETARDNALRLGLGERAHFVLADFTKPIGGKFDLVVCNPPYVRSGDIPYLSREVRDHDPRRALDGGADGLDAYRALAKTVPALLAPGGALVLELGIGQERSVRELLQRAGLLVEPARADLSGIPRALLARRP